MMVAEKLAKPAKTPNPEAPRREERAAEANYGKIAVFPPRGSRRAARGNALTVGRSDDAREREAERVADGVTRTQPTCAACERDGGTPAPTIVHDVLRTSGQPLGGAAREFFESRFGHNFSRVRVHADAQAAKSAEAVRAMAYTVGSHVVFGSGRFAPETASGKHLLAHELAHVVQQAGASGPVLQRAPLLTSTMKICHRVLKGEHVFHVSDGGIIVTANAAWEPSEEWQGEGRPQCGSDDYNITLSDKGSWWDSEYGTCSFEVGHPFSRQWANLPEKDYYLTIFTNNTNPNCCLVGDVEVTQQKGLSGESCTKPPPGPLEILHDALTIAGLVPGLGAIPDGINAGIYIIEGDWVGAGISAVAIIPIFGEAASAARLGEKTVLRVSGESVTKLGKEEIATGLKEAKAAQAAREAREAEAARAAIAGAEEIKLSQAEYEKALSMVFPSQRADEVAKLVDEIGQHAATRAMDDARFVQAMRDGNITLAGTLFHSAAAQEARAIPRAALPSGWTLEAERTIQAGAGGSRADLLLHGPGGNLVEFDWKTTGRSALSSGARKEMARHAGQITVNVAGKLTVQQSRSWMDYVRPLL